MAAFLDTQRLANQGVITPRRAAITTTGLTPAVEPTRIYRVQQALISGDRATQDWADSVRDLAQAMSQFSQITGNALDPVSQWVGRMAAGLDTGRALARTLGLGGTTGGLTAIGLGAGSVGWQLGMQGGMSPGRAAAAGALSGAGQGAYYGGAGFAIGAIVGATSAYFGAQKAEEEVRRAKDLQAQTLVAQYGTLDALLATVSSLGLNTQTFLERYYGDPQEFAKAVTDLNNALTAQRREAEALGKSLQEVQRVQGVLSRDQLAQMQRQLRSGGEGAAAVVEFAAQQRQQAEQGLTQAVAALAALEEQSATTLTQFEGAAQAAAAGLVVAFTEAIQQGESAISVLQRLGPSIQSLQAMFGRAGISGGAGFGQLSVLQDIATGAQTGPIVSLAQGLGQALAGFANSGLLSPELFTDLANGIGQAYKQLELLGKGGLEAARLMQPSLQAIWQMIQDNPELADRLDDSTKALLEFAVANGLVGDKFRPAIDRMIDAIDALLKKLDELIDKIKGVPPVTTNTGDNTNNSGNNNNGSGNNNGGGGQGGDYTNLPMAMGGIVTRPTRALIGEAGPEAVIPLSRGSLFSPTITVIAPLQVDGYEMARAVTRYQPSVYRTYGAA
jgi:hypothetical protein